MQIEKFWEFQSFFGFFSIFIIFTSSMGEIVYNKLIAYTDDATFFASADSPVNDLDVTIFLNNDLERIVR